MPVYNVAMGQALKLNALGNDTLYTGPPPQGRTLQSCTAVVMVNTQTWAAGLFHFPSGALGAGAKRVIGAMKDAVQPDSTWLVLGGSKASEANSGYKDQEDPELDKDGVNALRLFVNATIGGQAVEQTAATGAVGVRVDQGAVAFSKWHENGAKDMGKVAEGAFTNGQGVQIGRVWWSK